jgi:hypothetical protein
LDGKGTDDQRHSAYKSAIGKVRREGMTPREALIKAASENGVESDLWLNVSQGCLQRYLDGLVSKWNGCSMEQIASSWLFNVHCTVFAERIGLGRTAKEAFMAAIIEHHRLRGTLPEPGKPTEPVLLPRALLARNKGTGSKAMKRLQLAGLFIMETEATRESAARYKIRLPLDEEKDVLAARCMVIGKEVKNPRAYTSEGMKQIMSKLEGVGQPLTPMYTTGAAIAASPSITLGLAANPPTPHTEAGEH